jgi:hypothetical protein
LINLEKWREVDMNGISIGKRFAIVATVVLGPIIMAHPASAKDKHSVTPVEEPVVVDADGDKLGSLLGLNGPLALVLVGVQRGLFSLYVSKSSIIATGSPLLFTTNDCTGIPYVQVQAIGIVTQSTLAPPGNSLYVGDPSATPQIITPLSLLQPAFPGGPAASCQSTTPPPPPPGVPPPPGPPQLSAVRALRLVDLNTVFSAPFSIRPWH